MKPICDLHTHSVLSRHAYSSMTENIDAARKAGLKYYGISEHQPDDYGVGAMSFAFSAITRCPRWIDGVYVFRGCEFNILENGLIDPAGVKTKNLDYGIASFHAYAYHGEMDKETITNCYLNAMDYDFIKILGHIDDGMYPADFEKLVAKAHDTHKLIELNNSSLRENTFRKDVRKNLKEVLDLSVKYKQPIIINSDAHILYEVGEFTNAEKLLKEVNFPDELVLNYNEELFKEYFTIEE